MFRINGVGLVCAFGLAAIGCSGAPADDGSDPSIEAFEFAAENADKPPVAKPGPGDDLVGKGAATVPFGKAIMQSVTIAPGQTVSFQTSAISDLPTVDTVLALFRRHDNDAYLPPGMNRIGIQTLALNDDISWPTNPYSSLSYTNTSGQTENAHLALFGFGGSIGWVELSGVGQVEVKAGSTTGQGTAGVAFTNGTASGDPWLYMFDYTPGQGNGAFNDDNPEIGGADSKIPDATGAYMWFVASAYQNSSGSTTINY
jgi:hypothetical protein